MVKQYTIRRDKRRLNYLLGIEDGKTLWGERKYAIVFTLDESQRLRSMLDDETRLEKWYPVFSLDKAQNVCQ